MVFKSIPDSALTVVATCAFITSACFVTQDHLVYIPQLLSAVTGRAAADSLRGSSTRCPGGCERPDPDARAEERYGR
jgi:hypothetical protein